MPGTKKAAKKPSRAKSPKRPTTRTGTVRKPAAKTTRGSAGRAKPSKAVKPAAPKSAAKKAPPPKARGRAALAPRVARAAKGLPVHVVPIDAVTAGDPGSNPGSPEFAYRILAEGDSWFTIAGIPSSNLLYELRLPQQGIVVNIAYPGDTLKDIADLADNRDLKKMLTERFGYRWHAIVLSAGGNDLIGRAGQLLRNPGDGSTDAADYVDGAALDQLIADVQQGYRDIVGLRDSDESDNNDVPVVVHGYDFPTPRNAPARFFAVGALGPWLYKAFNDKQIGEAMQVAVSDYLVDALAEGIAALASGPAALPNFHFVETRNSLQRAALGATGLSGDWLNEIHPSQTGYRKIAERIAATLVTVLPG